MVEPKWVQWDPDVTVAALAYSDSLVLYRARPTFKAMASLSIQVQPAMALLWHIRTVQDTILGWVCPVQGLAHTASSTCLQQSAFGPIMSSGPVLSKA